MNDDALAAWTGPGYPRAMRRVVDRIAVPYLPNIATMQGWWPLVESLHRQLAELDPDYRIRFIREYKGYLQVDLIDSPHRNVAAAKALLAAFAEESRHTCEECGKPGSRRLFHSVLCNTCRWEGMTP